MTSFKSIQDAMRFHCQSSNVLREFYREYKCDQRDAGSATNLIYFRCDARIRVTVKISESGGLTSTNELLIENIILDIYFLHVE